MTHMQQILSNLKTGRGRVLAAFEKISLAHGWDSTTVRRENQFAFAASFGTLDCAEAKRNPRPRNDSPPPLASTRWASEKTFRPPISSINASSPITGAGCAQPPALSRHKGWR